MAGGQIDGTESDRPQSQMNVELHLASPSSVEAKAWNVGLLLGAVSELCQGMRFDPTLTSHDGFRHFSSLLRSHACHLAESFAIRDGIDKLLTDFVLGIDRCYGSESHAELLGEWRRGVIETDDLRISACKPLGLFQFQAAIEHIVPHCVRPAFLAGCACGNAWIHCDFRLRNDVPAVVLPTSFVKPVSAELDRTEVNLDSEWEQRASTMFVGRGWSMAEWRTFMFQGGHNGGEQWSQFGAVSAGIDWISQRLTLCDQSEGGPAVPAAVIAVNVPVQSEVAVPQHENERYVASEYLGVSYCKFARTARREGIDTPLRFDGKVLPWHLFVRLIKRRNQWTSHDQLRSCWVDAGRCEPEPGKSDALYQAIFYLRSLIKHLNLTVVSQSKIGYRIEETQGQ